MKKRFRDRLEEAEYKVRKGLVDVQTAWEYARGWNFFDGYWEHCRRVLERAFSERKAKPV